MVYDIVSIEFVTHHTYKYKELWIFWKLLTLMLQG